MIIDLVFNRLKTRYTNLDTLSIFRPNTNKVALYINLEMVLKNIFVDKVNNELVAEQDDAAVRTCMVSNIINLAQHYRWYFVRKGYDCEAYIYYNYPAGDYKNYIHNLDYRSYYNNKMYNSAASIYLTRCMSQIVNVTNTISKYVNGVHILSSDIIESSVIPYIIYKDIYHGDNSIQHIIVTNDKYDLQYVNEGFDIIVPRQEDTVKINKDNVYNHLKGSYGSKDVDIKLPTNHLEFVLSIIGCKYRNINKLSGLGFASIIKLIEKATDKIMITGNTTDVITFCNLMHEKYRKPFLSNYKCTSVKSQYDSLTELDRHKITDLIDDRYDDRSLAIINEKYFQKYPIISFGNRKEQTFNRENQVSIFDR